MLRIQAQGRFSGAYGLGVIRLHELNPNLVCADREVQWVALQRAPGFLGRLSKPAQAYPIMRHPVVAFSVVAIQFNGCLEFSFGSLPVAKVNETDITANGMCRCQSWVQSHRPVQRLDRKGKHVFRVPKISITKFRVAECLASPGLRVPGVNFCRLRE